MKTIIVPTDFSATAYNAARYALGLAAQMGTARILLYHAYELIVPIPDVPTSIPMVDPNELKAASLEGLEHMKQDLLPVLPGGVELDYRADNNLLAASIEDLSKEEKADLIIMGTTGGSQLEEILIGSNTIDVVKHTSCPVMIIPSNVSFQPIKRIVFACDFKKVGTGTPIYPLKRLLNVFQGELHVLNIDKEGKGLASDTPEASLLLDTLLEGLHPKYHFIDHSNVVQGIMEFADREKADLIITIPRKHGLFESIFKRSRTAQLAFHTHIPMLAIHE
ncbi:universal stress protein [Chitinophaga pinensis]|uniref:UspA domain protein n=1 Tax=Chitinophaga pinensis (strain ATCC 43595 / DSM 2588 / LMG 13176 / NBRC 15968 / NCIMB 11800 / UQM 2034) TaxID=485918 RepID=A0A979FZG9_CHIPD|nr:universal stress protein [Chitinophaga pinensis]ACU58000.1 UspA domain protein [Chitinophaga pinensis DSM 2588]